MAEESWGKEWWRWKTAITSRGWVPKMCVLLFGMCNDIRGGKKKPFGKFD